MPKVQEDLAQTPKKIRRRFFQNRYFAQKCPLDIYYELLITLPRIFLRNWEFFAQILTKFHIFSQKTCFSTKCSTRLLQCNFDKPVEILIGNCVKLSCQKHEFRCYKYIIFLIQKSFSKKSSKTVENGFGNYFFLFRRKFSNALLEVQKKFSWKIFPLKNPLDT